MPLYAAAAYMINILQDLKKKIERLAQYTMGIYLSIIQKIEQADATTCFVIIACIIKSIGNVDLYEMSCVRARNVWNSFLGSKIV